MGVEIFGWQDDQKEVEGVLARQKYPLFASAPGMVVGAGDGKVTLLYEALYKVLGGRENYNVRTQTIGDCVSMGAARAVDILRAIQAATGKGTWVAETCTEALYAASRVEIGKGRLGSGDGSVGGWAAEAAKEIGTLLRLVYGSHDLREYSGKRAREWGMPRAGLPDALEPSANEHLVRTVSLVTTTQQCKDSLAAGYPVTIASNQGFTKTRDKDGFAKPSGTWPHQMCIIGWDDVFRRPGGCIDNSWGPDWISGPIRHNQPEGSFWADEEVIARILRQQDSWAFSEYDGYPPKDIDWGSAF